MFDASCQYFSAYSSYMSCTISNITSSLMPLLPPLLPPSYLDFIEWQYFFYSADILVPLIILNCCFKLLFRTFFHSLDVFSSQRLQMREPHRVLLVLIMLVTTRTDFPWLYEFDKIVAVPLLSLLRSGRNLLNRHGGRTAPAQRLPSFVGSCVRSKGLCSPSKSSNLSFDKKECILSREGVSTQHWYGRRRFIFHDVGKRKRQRRRNDQCTTNYTGGFGVARNSSDSESSAADNAKDYYSVWGRVGPGTYARSET